MYRKDSDDIMRFLEGMASSDDVLFGFLDEGNHSPEDFTDSGNFAAGEKSDADIDVAVCNYEENIRFWREQEQLLHAALFRTSSIETKIRQATKEVLKEVRSKGLKCICRRRPVTGGCGSCLRGEVSRRLRDFGYDCVITKSKWRNSHDIPAGEHEYLEILDKSSKKSEIRVVIEISFRTEFEIARGGEEYKRFIGVVPEVYVGKTERLKPLIKILCTAAKKCMKDKKMHMAPWRKQKYMLAKWLGMSERKTMALVSEKEADDMFSKAAHRVSMLNYDIFGDLSVGMGGSAAVAAL